MKLSRSKWENFIRCPFCFYIKEKHNIDPPRTPGHPINSRVDSLLKAEFDELRKNQQPHSIFKKNNLNFVPYKLDQEKLDAYRSIKKGVEAKSTKTKFTLFGALDDLWLNKDTDEIVVLDYKATSNKNDPDYVNSSQEYHKSYKRQLDFYAYLITKNGMSLARTGYFYVCNADKAAETFSGVMRFDETLVPYEWDSDWIEPKIQQMINILNSNELPPSNQSCENCAYANQRLVIEG